LLLACASTLLFCRDVLLKSVPKVFEQLNEWKVKETDHQGSPRKSPMRCDSRQTNICPDSVNLPTSSCPFEPSHGKKIPLLLAGLPEKDRLHYATSAAVARAIIVAALLASSLTADNPEISLRAR